MKLLFSEYKSDYGNYIFPYAIWAIPEADETPGQMLAKGFLPASRHLDRFYMCRHIRIDLHAFKPSSENRRILRKGEGIACELVPRAAFDYTRARRRFYKHYADIKFGKDVMTYPRLDSLFGAKITSHLLHFADTERNKEVGTATLYLEAKRIAYYYYAFYDLNYYERNLGMYMMTRAVAWFADAGFEYLYLGSCYSKNALYKTQFAGAEFFNGFRWSGNLKELKYLISRDSHAVTRHLLETEEFMARFYEDDLSAVTASTAFQIRPAAE